MTTITENESGNKTLFISVTSPYKYLPEDIVLQFLILFCYTQIQSSVILSLHRTYSFDIAPSLKMGSVTFLCSMIYLVLLTCDVCLSSPKYETAGGFVPITYFKESVDQVAMESEHKNQSIGIQQRSITIIGE